MEYISTSKTVMTAAQLIEVLSQQNKDAQLVIQDDNENQRPLHDVAIDGDRIVLCDF